jgi:hypothetical protein
VTAVLVALIGLFGALIVEFIRRNDRQHQRGYTLLESIDHRVMGLDEKFDKHVADTSAHQMKERA